MKTNQSLNILMLSTFDVEGGATTWFMHLADVLHKAGYNIAVVVKYKKSTLPYVHEVKELPKENRVKRVIKKYCIPKSTDIFFATKPEYAFFPNEAESSKVCTLQQIMDVTPFNPDLIITGLTYELANTTTFQDLHVAYNAPIFMTAFDANVFTGGCHAFFNCRGFQSDCADCPGVKDDSRKCEVQKSFSIKLKNIKEAKIGVLYAAPWTKYYSQLSACFKSNPQYNVGMCIDTDFYTNANRDIAKRVFNLPDNSFVIFVGSANLSDKRKGFVTFVDSLKSLWNLIPENHRDKVYILLAGRNIKQMDEYINSIPPFHLHHIDFISDFRLLSLAYQASDLFVCASLEDAGPMMVAEAMSCGTPVVGYKTGLMFDQSIIRNGVEGYSVELADFNKLAKAICNVVMLSKEEYKQMSDNCRLRANELLSQEAFLSNIDKLLQDINL